MAASRIITLTTDFGSRDGFVAAMKGVMLGICPDAIFVDVSHDIPHHDIAHASFVLGSTTSFFPRSTIHVAVVDPGVGSSRHPLLIVTPDGYFIGPDNGIFSYVLLKHGLQINSAQGDGEDIPIMSPIGAAVPDNCDAYVLNRADYWLGEVSGTFHGRDIFAPVAAHLASGVSPHYLLGQAINEVTALNIPRPINRDDVLCGNVIYIDHFGNLVTNIKLPDTVERNVEVRISARRILGLSQSYYNTSSGLLATIGSHGYMEIAVRRGNASDFLNAGVGTPLEVRLPHDSL